MYFDMTALYSWSMMQYLPTGNHKVVEIDNMNFDYLKNQYYHMILIHLQVI